MVQRLPICHLGVAALTHSSNKERMRMNNIKKLGYSKKQAAEATSLSVRSIAQFIAISILFRIFV